MWLVVPTVEPVASPVLCSGHSSVLHLPAGLLDWRATDGRAPHQGSSLPCCPPRSLRAYLGSPSAGAAGQEGSAGSS